ncbi:hypothetical protein QWJ34_21370 [Saccharibacillus sp. CPCC 101409]|uniref:hypothetical protein n=1 Tax=Saccharibacillus sp. CPCC 101409 TaxID=3058041 RepID=UPI002672AE33|nr:hypothetical protein [Saccharibacillus sp. CPCC 101409]MDO3412328.1 hypothetical protein [Saccharibacillus sp. CPCC 101409]
MVAGEKTSCEYKKTYGKRGLSAALTVLLLSAVLAGAGCSNGREAAEAAGEKIVQADRSMVDPAVNYASMKQMAADSPLIAEVAFTGKGEARRQEGLNSGFDAAEVRKVWKGGQELNGRTIGVLDLESTAFRSADRGDRFVLFLQPYEAKPGEAGAAAEKYAISGVYQGLFRVDDRDRVIYEEGSYAGESNFQMRATPAALDEFERQVRSAFD